MSINSINQYTYGISLTDFLTGSTDEEESSKLNSAGSGSSLSAVNKKAYAGAYGASMQSEAGMAVIKQALEEIEPDSSGRITFNMIKEHRAELEENFTTMVKAGLLVSGVDQNVEFQLISTPEGEMQVQCDNPEQKAQIESFFKTIPELKDQFLYIQALGNMERAQTSATATTHRLNAQATKAGLQSQAMETFFNDIFSSGMGYSSLLANFDSEETADYFVGANYFV
jgi:predicted unusual protein kinase regulating ubiquinone biosynthesis (AarF/ABC1/UbiB family)